MQTQIEEQAISEVMDGMVRAWNAASGAEFAAHCEEDADFVNIYGTHVRGREAIAAGHDYIFRTIYEGSTMEGKVTQVRFLAPDIALVHVRARLQIPRGAFAGEMNSVPSMVMRRGESGWLVASFQNTLVGNPPKIN